MVNAFPLYKGKISVGTGVHSKGPNGLIHCEADGTFTIEYADGTSEATPYAMVAGDDRLLTEKMSGITIIDGTFSLG